MQTNIPGGRYWEPGVEETHVLPKDEWMDDEPLPFDDPVERWTEEMENASNAQLIGMWENGVAMTNEEYDIWLAEVRERGLMEQVFGGDPREEEEEEYDTV